MKAIHKKFIGSMVLFCLLLALIPSAWSADALKSSEKSGSELSAEIVTAKIDEISKASGQDDATHKKLLELYRQSLDALKAAEFNDAQAKKFVQSIETAPVEIDKIKKVIAQQQQAKTQPQKEMIFDSLKEVEQQLLKIKTQYTSDEANSSALNNRAQLLSDRPLKIGQRLAEIKQGEDNVLEALKASAPTVESPAVSEARQWMLLAQLQALRSETRMLQQELISMPLLLDLANLQRDQARLRLAELQALMQQLEGQVNRKRQEEAQQSKSQAEEAAERTSDSSLVLQQAAARNTELGDVLQTITTQLEKLASEKTSVEKALKKVEEGFSDAKQKIALAGASHALGLMLHERRQMLPHANILKEKSAKNVAAIADTGLLQVQYTEERKQLDTLDEQVQLQAGRVQAQQSERFEPELQPLLSSRRELLDKILAANQTYFSQLSEIELLYHNLITAVEAFQEYLAERLLWIRSMPLMQFSDFRAFWQEVTLLLSPDQWRAIGAGLARQSLATPFLILVTFFAIFLMIWGRRIRDHGHALLQQARNPLTYRFAQPLKILVVKALVALPVPLFLFTCGWELNRMADQSDLSRAVAGALIVFAYRYLFMRWFRSLLAPNGLAENLFRWSKTMTSFLYREIGIFMASFLPAVFVTQVAFFAVQHAGGNHLLGRLALMLVLVITLVSNYRILHPKTALCQQILNTETHPVFTRLYPLLFTAVLLLPLFLMGLVIAGYVFAVGTLVRCIVNSIWLISGLVLCHQLIEQWLIQTSRQLARQKALRQRARAQAKMDTKKETGEVSSGVIDDVEEDPVELTTESRKLIDTLVAMGALIGLWLVWREVLPALSIFKEFTLWSYSVTENGQSTVVPVTLADAGLTVLISVITMTATLHLPAVLKIALFQHLRLGPGGQYTAVTLTRYSIGGIGVLVIADILGFSWSQIQWLVAALGVGIGFGLQEIVANFISGLIILFERPIRVGDVVTVGSTDGVVTRIRIRATTIKDFDGKELLVPNKDFISGHLLNWSLSDPVIRILVPVGVAYGSDVQTAMRLMLQAAQENPLILQTPSPIVTFDSFGDNSLLLTLRCFIGSVDQRVAAKSALHLAIDQLFRDAEITMAFPQRDVHLDATKPLEIRVVGNQSDVQEAVAGRVV